MPLPSQTVIPGVLENAYRRGLKALLDENALARLWVRDASLWPSAVGKSVSAKEGLSWLDQPVLMSSKLVELESFAAEIEKDGIHDIVTLGFGLSHFTPRVVAQTFPIPAERQFLSLDSTDPACVRSVAEAIDLRKALFFVAGKSGNSVETHIHFLYFLDRLKATGVERPGQHFVSIAEEDSYLDAIAGGYGFRRRFLDSRGLGARYSFFSYFSLVRAALWGLNLRTAIANGVAMCEACGPGTPTEANPALALGALLAAGALAGLDKLTFLTGSKIFWFSRRIEELIAVSTGKEGRGIVPLSGGWEAGRNLPAPRGIRVLLRLREESSPEIERAVVEAKASGQPFVESVLGSPLEIGAEYYKWEVASALAAYLLQVTPFDLPAVRESEVRTAQILERLIAEGHLPVTPSRVREGNLELYAEGGTRHQISTLSLAEALRTFFEIRCTNSYLAVLAFLPHSTRVEENLETIRGQLSQALGIPVLVSFGPRYLYSLGQLYKDGPPTGLFVMLTATHEHDIAIPGAGYSFGELQMAQALADMDSLVRLERPVIRLHLMQGPDSGMAQLEKVLQLALRHVRPI